MSLRSVAIFGGSFNPIHWGHLAVAEEVRVRHPFDQVIFVPNHRSPHKGTEGLEDAKARLVMAHLAVVSNPYFTVSDFEVERGGVSYSIDTIRHFKGLFGADVSLYFILGADMLKDLSTWKEINEALRLCRFIAVTRPGDGSSQTSIQRFLDDPGPEIDPLLLGNIRIEDCVKIDLSSTLIRQRVRDGKSIKYLVPESVEQFIQHRRLYL